MNRRKFVASLPVAAVAAKPLKALAAGTRGRRTSKRPLNVVLMICDDIGFGDLGCYGSKLPTPNLDRMAREGMRFTRFNGGHPLCSASRASLLTGRYGSRMGTTGAYGPYKDGTALDETLLSNLFKSKGYRNKAIGKWHLGGSAPYLPTSRGFDSYFGLNWSVDMNPIPLMRDAAVLEELTDIDVLTPRYTEEALRFLGDVGERPFFLYLGFAFPHHPARASEKFRGKSGLGNQGDAIAEIDWVAGEVLRTLEEKKLSDDTLVLFTGDHGPWGQGSPGLLRGRKASTWEGGFRVPLVAKLSGVVPAGALCETPCCNMDVLPTLAKMCDLPLPSKPLDGVDMSGLLDGSGAIEERAQLYFSPMSRGGLTPHCIRKGDWKLRVAQGAGGEIYINDAITGAHQSAWLQTPELYNLHLDPAESYNVANFHEDVVAALQRELEAAMRTFPKNVQDAFAELKQTVGEPAHGQPGMSPRLPTPAA